MPQEAKLVEHIVNRLLLLLLQTKLVVWCLHVQIGFSKHDRCTLRLLLELCDEAKRLIRHVIVVYTVDVEGEEPEKRSIVDTLDALERPCCCHVSTINIDRSFTDVLVVFEVLAKFVAIDEEVSLAAYLL